MNELNVFVSVVGTAADQQEAFVRRGGPTSQ